MTNLSQIRVRFAPSPTGYLHVGGLRTALYNYLFARKNGGIFILRIEDTDRTRFVEGAVENLIESLSWCRLGYDEGPAMGGNYGPYFQSERLGIYKRELQTLIGKKEAYYCFCPAERIEKLRQEQQKAGQQTKYDKHCLNLTDAQIGTKVSAGVPHVLRLNVPANRTIVVDDMIRGRVEFGSDLLDDQVLLKADGYPTYHLANVIDDHLMGISHVIRGEEWLSSTPKHILLYDAFGWEKPLFAHLPLLLNPDRSKLSKRQGDVAVEDYRAKGYLPEALLNFVALLGWNPGTQQEIFSLEELVKHFSIEGVNKSGAVFNIEKLNAFNFEHLRKKDDSEVMKMLKEDLAGSSYSDHKLDDQKLKLIVEAMRPRISFVKEIIINAPYFFGPPDNYDPDVIKKRWEAETPRHLERFIEQISLLNDPGREEYETALHKAAESLGIVNAKLIHGVRLSLSGVGGGPGLYDILFILGKDESIRRIEMAIRRITI